MAKKELSAQDPHTPDYLGLLGECEKVAKVQSLTLSSEDRVSTGLLSLDAILGGGITAGMYTLFGPEQSAKTTAAITMAGASISQDVGTRILWDAENSSGSSTDYIANIFETLNIKSDVETVFGVKKGGKYIVRPQIYYRDEGEADKFFDFLAALLRRLPNKRYEDKRWWLVYPKDRELLAKFGSVMDKGMSRSNDAIYVPAKNGSLQGMVVIDSYPSLLPEGVDVDDPGNDMALQARTFSKGLQRIKGRLRSKRFALVGINQLRTAPMVRFGCIHGETMVPLVDGRSFTMQEIVTQKIKGQVWSLNEKTKEIEPRSITAWHYNGEVEKPSDWITMSFDAIDTKNGVGSITCTPDHEVFTRRGWIPAKKIRAGDKVLTKYHSRFNGRAAEFLTGCLSGDSTIEGGRKKAMIRFQDSENEEYLKWKAEILSDVYAVRERRVTKQNRPQVLTKSCHDFARLKKAFKSRSPLSSLAQWSELALAVWFMDDGHAGRLDTNAPRGQISIKRFKNDPDTFEAIKAQFKSRGYEIANREDNTAIHFTTEGYLKLCKDICRYVPPCMEYKLHPEYRGQYKPFRLDFEEETRSKFVEVLEVSRGSLRKFRNKAKYDITVEGNHNYMIGNKENGMIVHNSPEYEPGGQALKFYSDVRLRMYPHALSAAPFAVKGGEGDDRNYEFEDSLDGGKDKYRYIKATAHKNKLSVPNRFTWLRLWVEDSSGNGRGYDPVFDTLWSMSMTGQIDPMSNKKAIRIHPHGRDAMKKTIGMLQFKQLVIGDREQREEVWNFLGVKGVIDLRKWMRKQMLDGTYEDLYIANRNSKLKPKKDEDEGEGDDDE